MLRSGSIIMIKQKGYEGKTPYKISKETGLSKNTVKKYLNNPVKPHGLKGRKKESKLDPYKTKIQEMMSQGMFNCAAILERLQEQGYDGGITILKDYVHPYRPARALPAVQRYETQPGKQAQMDWGITNYIDKDGEIHKVPVFAMVLGYSRIRYIEFTKRCDIYSLMHCIINAFEYFGGIPKTILTDNMKTVIEGSENGKKIWNKKFEDFAAVMGFVPKTCRIRRPETKGKVERLVDYVKDNFIPGMIFKDLKDLNDKAYLWCEKVNRKKHGTTGEIPVHAICSEELLPLPDKSVRDRFRWETRKVSKDGFVSYDGAKYGLPWQYSNREVRVRAINGKFQAYYEDVELLNREIEYASGKYVLMKGQYQGLAEQNGIPVLKYARQVSSENVESRSLQYYDMIAGVVSNG